MKIINIYMNEQKTNGRLIKFMCSVLNAVAKFSSLQLSSKI